MKGLVPMQKDVVSVFLALLLILGLEGSAGQTPRENSPEAADALSRKIEKILAADAVADPDSRDMETVTATEAELESFVLFEMKAEIPPRVDSIDVTIEPGRISAMTELYFDSELSTGNPVVDLLVSGSHRLFVAGTLAGHQGQGKFELQGVQVDGIPVPLFLIDVLVERYVRPEYPNVDLDESFQIPWGIEEITLLVGEAELKY